MREFRRHVIVRVFVCVLLTWAAADLLVPQLCSAESFSQTETTPSQSKDRDDCFCCCSHTERPLAVEVVLSVGTPTGMHRLPADRLAPGISRRVYHPPLFA